MPRRVEPRHSFDNERDKATIFSKNYTASMRGINRNDFRKRVVVALNAIAVEVVSVAVDIIS